MWLRPSEATDYVLRGKQYRTSRPDLIDDERVNLSGLSDVLYVGKRA